MALDTQAMEQLISALNEQLAQTPRVVAALLLDTKSASQEELNSCRPPVPWTNGVVHKYLDGRPVGGQVHISMIDLLNVLCEYGAHIEVHWEEGRPTLHFVHKFQASIMS